MTTITVYATEWEHSGDEERYAVVLARLGLIVLAKHCEHAEEGVFVVETTLTPQALQAALDADDATSGFCFVSGRGQ